MFTDFSECEEMDNELFGNNIECFNDTGTSVAPSELHIDQELQPLQLRMQNSVHRSECAMTETEMTILTDSKSSTKEKKVARGRNNTRSGMLASGEKPYKCDQCSSAFVKKCNLKIHKRVHTGFLVLKYLYLFKNILIF